MRFLVLISIVAAASGTNVTNSSFLNNITNTSVVINDNNITVNNLQTTTQTPVYEKGEQGEQGMITTTVLPKHITISKGDKGDKGDKGEQGEQGEQGNKGDKGNKGEQGEAGLDGRDGVDAPAQIDSIYDKIEQANDDTKIQWHELDEDVTFVISFGSTAFVLALLNLTCTVWLCWKRLTHGDIVTYGKLKEAEMKQMHMA